MSELAALAAGWKATFSLRQRRLAHAAEVVGTKLEELAESCDVTWQPWAANFLAANETKDWHRVEDLILEAYRRVLFERDPRSQTVTIPTDEEWDLLPDALEEIQRRIGNGEKE